MILSELQCEESEGHPRHLEEEATGVGIMFDGYVKVYSAPYAYGQGTEAKRDDPKCSPLSWFSHPQRRVVSTSGSIAWKTIHPVCGIVKTTGPSKEGRAVLHGYESKQPFIFACIVYIGM